MKRVRDDVLNCTRCPLYKTRTWPVIGQGNHQASVVLVGEAPGLQEDKCGKPFQGQSGKVLDVLLQSGGLKREDIYICNVLKCRPPNNRNPLPVEIESCAPYLQQQLEIIKPQIIGCLGNFAIRFVFDMFGIADKCAGVTQIHGTVFEVNRGADTLKIIPLYHPASAAYNPNLIDILKADFQKLKNERSGL